jgi:hypothetical protein
MLLSNLDHLGKVLKVFRAALKLQRLSEQMAYSFKNLEPPNLPAKG